MGKTSIQTMKTSEMSKMSFDEILAAGKVSESDTPALREIPVEEIYENEKNFYSVDDVKDLADSIAMHGLLDPIVVTFNETAGMYQLISGHRRFKAWGQLWQQDEEKYTRIPAIVRTFPSPQMAELALIMANSTSRKLTSAEIGQQARRIETLLYELKEQGYAFPGRMREQVAKACQVSSTKLARLKVIDTGLTSVWKQMYTENKLPEETAYQLARLSPEIQTKIMRATNVPGSYGVEQIGKLMAEGVTYDGTQVKVPGCRNCTHGDAFLRHDMEMPSWACKGETCCLNCDKATRDWNPCSRMCGKAKAVRSEATKAEKAKAEAKRQKELNKVQTEMRESAIRLAKAADAAGLDDKVKIMQGSYCSTSVGWIRRVAKGEETSTYGRNMLAPVELDVAQAAKALQCSADYICGITEALKPEPKAEAAAPELQPVPPIPVWYFGEPTVPGRYLCLVDMNPIGYAEVHEQQCDWDSSLVKGWSAYGRPVDEMFEVVAWYALPPEWNTPARRPEEKEEDEDV